MTGPNVFYLVKSLSEIEFQRMKRILATVKNASVLTELLEVMYAATDTDDFEKARKKFPANTQKYFSQYCSKLNNIILAILREDDDLADQERVLIQHLGNIAVLLERRLYKQTELFIEKAQVIIEMADLFAYQPALKYLETIYKVKNYRNVSFENFEIDDLSESIGYVREYILLKKYAINQFKSYSNRNLNEIILARKESSKIASELNQEVIDSYWSLQVEELLLKGSKAINKANWEVAQHAFEDILDIYAENQPQKTTDKESYWSALTNVLQCMSKSKQFDEINNIEAQIQNCIRDYAEPFHEQVFLHKQLLSYTSLIYAYSAKGDMARASIYVTKADELMEEKSFYLLKPTIVNAHYHISFYYFVADDLDTAQDWLLKTLAMLDSKQDQRYVFGCRITELLIAAEQGENDLLKSLLRSFNRGKWAEYRDAEIEKLFRKVLTATVKSDFKDMPQKKYDEIISTLDNIPYSRYYYSNFNLLAWVISKREKKKYGETLRELYFDN